MEKFGFICEADFNELTDIGMLEQTADTGFPLQLLVIWGKSGVQVKHHVMENLQREQLKLFLTNS